MHLHDPTYMHGVHILFTLYCLIAGISMTLSSLIEAKNFNAGGHKIGLGLDMEGEHRCC